MDAHQDLPSTDRWAAPDGVPTRAAGRGPRSGFLGFWSSLPGVLTASAAVVTAITGGLAMSLRDQPEPQRPLVVNLYTIAGAEPSEPADVVLAGDDLAAVPSAVVDQSSIDADVEACAYGDDAACSRLLDALVVECADGYGLSCDVLWMVSPVGTDYELFGATCGGRVDPSYAGVCATL